MRSCWVHNAEARCWLTPQSMTSSVCHRVFSDTRDPGSPLVVSRNHLPTPGPVIRHLTNTIKNCKSESHHFAEIRLGSPTSRPISYSALYSIVGAALRIVIPYLGHETPLAKFYIFPGSLIFVFSQTALKPVCLLRLSLLAPGWPLCHILIFTMCH